MTTLQITTIDGQSVIVLPKDLAERLNVAQGGELRVVESLGGVFLSSPDSEYSAQLKVARDVMNDDEEALRRMAE